jgi:ketosteroid isomerase-like protein
MSQENVEVVRMPLQACDRSTRPLDQRIALRFPRLAAACLRPISKLAPSSRLRQVALRRAARLALAAYNRRDLDAVFAPWPAEFEYRPARNWVEAGLVEPCYRGREGYRNYIATADEVWGEENYLQPIELIDLGEAFLVLAVVRMRAQASGVSLTQTYAAASTLKGGQVIRVQEYFDHAEALEAAGLRE